MQQGQESRHIPKLDGLRGLAILLTFYCRAFYNHAFYDQHSIHGTSGV